MPRWAWVATVVAVMHLPSGLSGQASPDVNRTEQLGLNILVGGVSAAVTAYLRGEDPTAAALGGALGGLVWYAGKATAAARFSGSGFVGRQVGGVGASIVRNAGEGRGLLSRVVLPIGPLRIDVTPLEQGEVRTQVHLWDAGAVIYGILKTDLRFNADESLSAGAPVFVAENRTVNTRGLDVNGYATGGVIIRSGIIENTTVASLLAHERVHVVQHDFTSHVWSDPLEDFYLTNAIGTDALAKRIELGLAQPLFAWLTGLISDPSPLTRWFEDEAEHLDGN